jgi:hypothetical protein
MPRLQRALLVVTIAVVLVVFAVVWPGGALFLFVALVLGLILGASAPLANRFGGESHEERGERLARDLSRNRGP